MSELRVRDLMTADVHVLRPNDTVAALQDMMGEKHIRHVPVLTEADFVRHVAEGAVDADSAGGLARTKR